MEKTAVAMVSFGRHSCILMSPAPPAALSRMRNRSAILKASQAAAYAETQEGDMATSLPQSEAKESLGELGLNGEVSVTLIAPPKQ
jgi:hypothetical protein